MSTNRAQWLKALNINYDSDLLDKKEITEDNAFLMLARAQDIFEYKKLPETVKDYIIERALQITGHVTFFKDNDGALRVDVGALGGMLNESYEYTQSNVTNPFLKVAKTFYNQDIKDLAVKKDCVIMRNDAYFNDIISMIKRNAVLEAETYLTMQYQIIYGRLPILFMANGGDQKKAFDLLIESTIKGEKMSAILDEKTLAGVQPSNILNIAKPDDLLQLMELSNYYKSKSYNDIGLNANYNMKREAINESEAGLNKDALIPYINQMLKWRKRGIEEVNAFFGTNIEVELSELWKVKQQEVEKTSELLTEKEPEEKTAETTEEVKEESTEVINNDKI